MKIQKLPAEARSKLQSGLIITDAVQCVLELVHNSLDAEATGIAVSVNLKTYQIRVIDNGKGIGKEDFEFVGEKFMTSKYSFNKKNSTFPTYGFRGVALSCLLDVCKTLTIETKSENNGPTLVKVFKNNIASAIIEVDSKRSGTGTTVTIEDFMSTMPVRKKRITEVFELEEIKSQLQYLAVIHFNVCFTLRNEIRKVILLQTPQASNTLESISNIFGKTVAKSLKAFYYKENEYKITGFISLKPQIQNSIQLLYINKRIITKGVTHKFISSAIKEYMGKSTLWKGSHTVQIFKSLKNSYHHIFIIEIQCPHTYYELFTNVRKTTVEFRNWKDLLKCLYKAIKGVFKEFLNFESASNTEENDKNDNEKDTCGGIFGTSVLMNAVKGVPVKRGFIRKKDLKKKKKSFVKEVLIRSYTSQLEYNKKSKSPKDSSYSKEISHDSLESPIPRSHLNSNLKANSQIKSSETFNRSFLEFYEWVKANLETDQNALNLYKNFLQFKNDVNFPEVIAEFKSPVVGGKRKRKNLPDPKRLDKKEEKKQKRLHCISALDEGISVITCQQQKICPDSHLRIKKGVQFTEHMNNDIENFNFEPLRAKGTSVFRKSYNLSSLPKVQFIHTLPSLTSSEMQLTNIIKFRNWTESNFYEQPPLMHKNIRHENSSNSASNTWTSHYQDFVSENVDFLKSSVTVARNFPENFELSNLTVNLSSIKITNSENTAAFRDIEIQVSTPKMHVPKVSTMVQTSIGFTPECPNCQSNARQGIFKEATESNEGRHTTQLAGTIISQEVPNPDFWNSSEHGYYDINLGTFSGSNEIISKIFTPPAVVEKDSISSEFACGQKTNQVAKSHTEESISKETQTLAVFWANSLKETVNTHITTDANSKSESTLPKTIPLEKTESSLQPIQTGFCLSERHDFIPKGLSPTFIDQESGKTFTLSPHEKCRIKLTVDNTQSDLLATVKWQDEFTGNFLKPAIPDGILDEMHQKVKERVLTFENPVLSASLSYCAVKVHHLLHSFAFTKELLSDVEVLGQLDKKFIVTKMKLLTPKKMELISLFDQHAVDERIKLEELIRDYSTNGKFISSRLDPSVQCVINQSDVYVLSDLSEKMLNFGLKIIKVNENTVSVNEIPTFLLNKHEKDLKNKKDVTLPHLLKALITNIVAEMRETKGAISKIPKIIYSALCREACHKAIKFNKALSFENINEMMNKLKNCKLPFQCAHGRPSVIPIIDLEDFRAMIWENESVDLEKLKRFQYQENFYDVKENSKIF